MSAVAQREIRNAEPLTLRPLQPTIGAEIEGVDLREPLTPELRDAIKAALLKYKVVFFRDQAIDRAQQSAFAAQFGRLYTHPTGKQPDPALPAVHLIAAEDFAKYEKVVPLVSKDEIKEFYHTDTSWRLVPTWGAVLRAVRLPDVGGDTVWVDAGLAYRNLPEETKRRLEGLFVTHDFRAALVNAGHDYPIVAHPIIRTHRETGEKILWADFTKQPRVIGVDRAESKEILELIADQYRRLEYQVRFSWRPGSIAFWDNRSTVHYAVRNYGDFPRLLERVLIADEPLYGEL